VSPADIWRERFRWMTPHFLASGPLALALALAYDRVGIPGLIAFALPPAFMMLSVHQYTARTRDSVEEIRAANDALSARNRELHDLTLKLRKTHLETIAALSRSMEAKDFYSGGHTERVATISVALARRLGYGDNELDAIQVGALLHDIGKIGIAETILHKPGPLDDDEWRSMREHPLFSAYILSDVELPEIVLEIARHSHERVDGAGYPDGIAGAEIPLPARIVLVADAFDALTSHRPYRRARTLASAMDEMRAHAGTQFCPQVVDALERLYAEEPDVLAERRVAA
jgi:putative nucleotidyltransferase with HDIG domain